MGSSTGGEGGGVEVDLDAGADALEQVVALMHRAFAEYATRGRPSGASLETADTVGAEVRGGTRLAVLRERGRVLASLKYRDGGDGTLYFSRLAVDPAVRGRGLAGTLVRALRTRAEALGLEGLSCIVRADEVGNIALYAHLGMVETGSGSRRSLTGAVLPVVTMRSR